MLVMAFAYAKFCRSVFYRSVMTSSSRAQKVMEDLQQNPYYEKYGKRIAELQKTSPEEFMERIERKEKSQEPKPSDSGERRYASVLKPKAALKESLTPSQKKLEDIFKLELVQDKEASEIKEIWQQYHMQKDSIAATIPVDVYKKIMHRVKKYPTFLFPLPRSQGYEFIMCQTSGNNVYFTTLLCYQVHKENAPECLRMVHFEELAEDKLIVLMRGEFDKNVIDAREAQCLANEFQMYYGQDQASKLQLLESFTNQPDNFKHMDLITELENLSIIQPMTQNENISQKSDSSINNLSN